MATCLHRQHCSLPRPTSSRLSLCCCRFKDAVNECSQALDDHPAYHRALVRRAKAYEQMGHYKQALSDIQKANKADTANPDTQVPCSLAKCACTESSLLPVMTAIAAACPERCAAIIE